MSKPRIPIVCNKIKSNTAVLKKRLTSHKVKSSPIAATCEINPYRPSRSSVPLKDKVKGPLNQKTSNEILLRQIEEQSFKESVTPEKLELCQQCLDKLISSELEYSSLLSRVKSIYDGYILQQDKEILKKDIQIKGLTNTLKEERRSFKSANKRLKELTQINAELENNVQDIKKILDHKLNSNNAQEKLRIVKEKAKGKIAESAKKYQVLRDSHDKLSRAIDDMRNKGFPVDSMLNEQKKLWIDPPSCLDSWSDYQEKRSSYTIDLSPIEQDISH